MSAFDSSPTATAQQRRQGTAFELNIHPADLEASTKSPHKSFSTPIRSSVNYKAYERAFSATFKSPEAHAPASDDDEDAADLEQGDLQEMLDAECDAQIEHSAEYLQSPALPRDDDMAVLLVHELGLQPANANPAADTDFNRVPDVAPQSTSTSRSQPAATSASQSVNLLADLDSSSSRHSHSDRQSIAQQYDFKFQLEPGEEKRDRYRGKWFAIMAPSNVPKETVMDGMKKDFGEDRLEYICIGADLSDAGEQLCLHIQLVLKAGIDRRTPFLDKITGSKCNYSVTKNELAWNEYIKKGGNYIEFGRFELLERQSQQSQITTTAASGTVTTAATTAPNPATTDNARYHYNHNRPQQPPVAAAAASVVQKNTTDKPMTVRARAEQRRQDEAETARVALAKAQTSVDDAMDYMRQKRPDRFLGQSKWYLETFKYVHMRAQRAAGEQGLIDKEFIWPDSFPDCTPRLRNTVNRWIKNHFFRKRRGKCLILIGPPRTGKTSFARSLPGQVNYFCGLWNIDDWSDFARYSVYDNVPWDEFPENGYPPPMHLLTQNGKISTTSKYRGVASINVQQPSIVLLRPNLAGSLSAYLTRGNKHQKERSENWDKLATIFDMGNDEYFYKDSSGNQSATSTSSSMSITDDNRRGGPEEFDDMARHHRQRQQSGNSYIGTQDSLTRTNTAE